MAPPAELPTSARTHPLRRLRGALAAICFVVVLTLLYLLFWPIRARPVAWSPPSAPSLDAPPYVFAQPLNPAVLDVGAIGPEDVAFDAAGLMYTGCADGSILRLDPKAGPPHAELFAQTGGRPLGLHFNAAGDLIVCDAHKGLLAIDPEGTIRVLATASADGIPFAYTNDLDIASTGVIYFTDASCRFSVENTNDALAEHVYQGRLLSYDPRTSAVTTLSSEFFFANGVALSPDESFLIVADTGNYSLVRYYLSGPRAGSSDYFAQNLPGFPDGVALNPSTDTLWVSLVSPRDSLADWAHANPWVKSVVLRLPSSWILKTKPFGMVLEYDGTGTLVRSLLDPQGTAFSNVTNAVAHDGRLYLGSLSWPSVGVIELD